MIYNIANYTRQSVKVQSLCIVLTISLILSSCGVKIHPPPAGVSTTFTINGIFANCHNPLSSPKPLTYNLAFIVWYYNGNDRTQYNNTVNISSSTTNPSSTVTFSANLPKTGAWSLECTIYATQCSNCAVTQNCTGFYAAYPVLHFLYPERVGPIPGNSLTMTVNNSFIGGNVPGTCGCIVPN
jgi:hypothetical protein